MEKQMNTPINKEIRKTKNKKQSKKGEKFLLLSVLLLVVVVIFFKVRPDHVMIQTVSGNVYFGELIFGIGDFLKVNNPHIIETIPSDIGGEDEIVLTPISNAFYSPESSLRISKEHTVLIQSLKDSSEIVKALKNIDS